MFVRGLIVLMVSICFLVPVAAFTSHDSSLNQSCLPANPLQSNHTDNNFTKASTVQPSSLDPAIDYESAGQEVLQNVYETLVAYDRSDPTVLVPVLCTEVPTIANGLISSDGLHYTFNLRSNVMFTDGTTMTADDVIYSIERALVINDVESPAWKLAQIMLPGYPGPGLKVNWDDVNASMTKVDTDTVTFNLITPYPAFLSIMATTIGSVVSKQFVLAWGGIVPNERNEWLMAHTCGTGPFKLAEWSVGAYWTLQRFDNYHGTPASFDFVTCKKVATFDICKTMLMNGEADGIDVPAQYRSDFEGLPGVTLYQGLAYSVSAFGFNQNIVSGTLEIGDIPLDFFADLNLRQAFVHAFDYDSYLTQTTKNTSIQPNGPIPKGMFGYDESIPTYDHNLTLTAEYLNKALDARTPDPTDTYADNGFHIWLYYNAGNLGRQAGCEMLKTGLERLSQNSSAGVTGEIIVDVQALDWPFYLDARENKWLPVFFLGFKGDNPDPDDFANRFCHQNEGFPIYLGLKNQSLTTLVENAAKELNTGVRAQMYSQIGWSCYFNAYYLWTDQPIGFRALRDWVHNYVSNPMDAGFIYYDLSFQNLPSAPAIVSAIPSNRQVNLTWTAPEDDGGFTITNYKVYRGTISGGETLLATVGTELSYLDIGLINGWIYYYKVSAVNSVGEGSKSNEVSAAPSPFIYYISEGKVTITGYIGVGGTIYIPSTIGGYPVAYIGSSAFEFKTDFISVTISNSVIAIGDYAFHGCTSMTEVIIGDSVSDIGAWAFHDCTSLGPVIIPNSVKNISEHAFDKCSSLSSVIIGNGVTTIGSCAFQGTGLTSVTIPDNVNTLGDDAFDMCISLTNITIGGGVATIGSSVFSNCYSLTNVTIRNGVTSIGEAMFHRCSSLSSLIIPNSVTSIGYRGFGECTSLTTITIPNDVTPIGQEAFYHCTSLASVTVGNGVTSIGERAFFNCESLTSIRFLGLVAPTSVGADWITGTNSGIKGHAYISSNFPAPGGVWNGLLMGSYVPQVPGAPSILAATPDNGQVILTWSAPFAGSSPIINYRVYHGTTAGGEQLLATLGNVQTYIDGGLTNGQTYWYKVSALNSEGEGSQSEGVSATPRTIPDAPSNLQATPGNVQVSLSWTAPANNGGAAIDYYIVYQDSVALPDHPTGTSTTITGLTNGQLYTFAVAAHNVAGESAKSGTASATPRTVPTAPTLISATTSSSQVVLIWTTPSNNGGSSISAYKVYRGTASGGETLQTTLGNVLTYTDSSLTNGQTYFYKISAVNSAGEGPPSNELSAKPLGAPPAPQNFQASPGDAYVNLSWQALANDGGSAITNYQVWRSLASGTETFLADAGLKLWYNDTPVTNGETYYYLVKAENSLGEGPFSDEASATPSHSDTVPSAPMLVSASPGNAEVVLAWTAPPSDGGSSISGYNVYRGTTLGGETLLATLGVVLTYLDVGLTNGATYFYSVGAINAIGEGALSNELSATPATVPGVPQSLQAHPGDTQVTLTWSVPSSDGGAPVTAYRVYRGNTPSDETLLIPLGSVLTFADTDLTNGQTYYYKISAINSVGEGALSEEVSATPASVPSAPRSLKAVANDASIELNWTAPSYTGPGTLTYHVFRDNVEIWNGMALTYIDTTVTNSVTYSYTVAANNTIGWGSNSSMALATPLGPPSVPLGFTAHAGDSYVLLNWSAPTYAGPGTLTYHMFRDGVLLWSGALRAYNDSAVMNGLTYSYQVAMQNDVGWGENSSAISATPQGPPSTPLNLQAHPGNAYINLTWQAPLSDGGAPIIGYHVWMSKSPGSETFYADAGPNLWFNYTDLTNGDVYYYKVSAVNAAGEGSLSNEISATPYQPATLPSVPLDLMATAGDGQVTLTWNAPSSDGGSPITGYKIYGSTSSGDEVYLNTIPNGHTGHGLIEGNLANGQTYYYQVSAVNGIGEGPKTNEVSATPLTIPSAPLNLVATAGDARVTLNWTAPTITGGSPVTNYSIYRGAYAGGEVLLVTLGNVLTYSDTGLTNDQTYYYKVSAANSVGESEMTEEVSATPTAPSNGGGNNTLLYIGIGVVAILAGFGAAQLIMMRRKK